MANIKTVFIGSEATQGAELEVIQNIELIELRLVTSEGFNANIFLDIPTAIKFSKTLRHEISKAKEVTNG